MQFFTFGEMNRHYHWALAVFLRDNFFYYAWARFFSACEIKKRHSQFSSVSMNDSLWSVFLWHVNIVGCVEEKKTHTKKSQMYDDNSKRNKVIARFGIWKWHKMVSNLNLAVAQSFHRHVVIEKFWNCFGTIIKSMKITPITIKCNERAHNRKRNATQNGIALLEHL